jgi:hypothetical protein
MGTDNQTFIYGNNFLHKYKHIFELQTENMFVLELIDGIKNILTTNVKLQKFIETFDWDTFFNSLEDRVSSEIMLDFGDGYKFVDFYASMAREQGKTIEEMKIILLFSALVHQGISMAWFKNDDIKKDFLLKITIDLTSNCVVNISKRNNEIHDKYLVEFFKKYNYELTYDNFFKNCGLVKDNNIIYSGGSSDYFPQINHDFSKIISDKAIKESLHELTFENLLKNDGLVLINDKVHSARKSNFYPSVPLIPDYTVVKAACHSCCWSYLDNVIKIGNNVKIDDEWVKFNNSSKLEKIGNNFSIKGDLDIYGCNNLKEVGNNLSSKGVTVDKNTIKLLSSEIENVIITEDISN